MIQVISRAPQSMDTAMAYPQMDFNKVVRETAPENVFSPHRSSVPTNAEVTRRRASTVGASSTGSHGFFDQLSIDTAVAMKPDAARDTICLCTPTPKIPRPRNAFILYRQHHQSQVTADNSKLSNPEISKIIGEKWKHESEQIKDNWKRLAEEEKQRHQAQYPNYRYQPRRGSKAQNNWPSTPTSEDQGRCSKCNGRSIATPRTPSTPVITPPSSAKVANAPHGLHSLGQLDTSNSRGVNTELSPVSSLPAPHHLSVLRGIEETEVSPGLKRRRSNVTGNYHAVGRSPGGYGDASMESLQGSPEVMQHTRKRSYPSSAFSDLSAIPRSHSGPMPPPPRPPGLGFWKEPDRHARRHSAFDESLRLPPLQTSMSPPQARPSALDRPQPMLPSPNFEFSSPDESQSGGLEHSVMSIPLKHKLGLLARISRPFPTSSPKGPENKLRGAFVAVEGPNPAATQEISRAVGNTLMTCDEVSLRSWANDADVPGNVVDRDRFPLGLETPNGDDPFDSYFRKIISWREKSHEIEQYLLSHRTERGSSAMKQQRTEAATIQAPSAKVPVALIRGGFSLTLADRYASSTAIADWFSPQDHWQWMASLWRGVAAPDLIIYVVVAEEEEITRTGNVEFVKHMGLIVVRVPASKPLDEATERRLAFELVEWIRERSFQEEVPKSWRLD